MSSRRFDFPKDFVFGSATAAYQIEGATTADGRGDSVWDAFCRVKGNIVDGSSGADACKHYELWEKDLDMLKELGLRGYRFSVAWPRIIPGGTGAVNEKGLAFYDRLVDGLLKRGIQPNCTLYHWDLPTVLEDKGGWMNRDTASAFEAYAEVVSKRLGDRVDMWATFNEPGVFTWLGYEAGAHAPGKKESKKTLQQVIHHVLLAHGLGLRVLRRHAVKPGAKLGIVLAPTAVWPENAEPATLEACEKRWVQENGWWGDPLMKGSYPPEAWALMGTDVPEVRDGDMQLICQKMDFLGLNYYSPARTLPDSSQARGWTWGKAAAGAPMADMPDWEIFAPGLESELLQFWQRYKLPIYVTENGMSVKADAVGSDGHVADPRRIFYLKSHLAAVSRAIQRGADIRGYFHWSLMDNFEWGYGYTQRFGLVHVDYATQKRTPKDSALLYKQIIQDNGFEAEGMPDVPSPFDAKTMGGR